MKRFLRMIFISFVALCSTAILMAKDTCYVIEIKQDIDKSSCRKLTMGLKEADRAGADYVILHLNTYGGAVDAADSMRTAILHSPIPVVAFIDIQAASAGALISIACDSIYMRNGSSMGAATVVNQNGEVMPDKYQSFMRAMMRATAESHGKKTIIVNGEEKEIWHRNPLIAEKMVDSANVLSFTPSEAMANYYCEGMAESIEEVVEKLDLEDCTIIKQELSGVEKLLLALMSPMLQGIFLMMIIGGIYFEIQSPGIGLPGAIALIGALLYFSPLYIEGLAMNWEIILFVAGLILLAVELFVLPGFGVAGIAGIATIVFSLIFSMVDNDLLYYQGEWNIIPIIKPSAIVLMSGFLGLVLSIWGASKLYPSKGFDHIAQKTQMNNSDGWVGVITTEYEQFIGMQVTTFTPMFPSGKVMIDGKLYEATMEYGSANKGDFVKIARYENGRLYCTPVRGNNLE